MVTFKIETQACLGFIPYRCKGFTVVVKSEMDHFSPAAIAEAMTMTIPSDLAPGTQPVIVELPMFDAEGMAITYKLEGDFGLFLNDVLVTAQGRDRVLVSRTDRVLSGTYQVKYTGTTPTAGATSTGFRLQVYDRTGNLVSDQTYSVPIAGTMASLGIDPGTSVVPVTPVVPGTPVVVPIGGKPTTTPPPTTTDPKVPPPPATTEGTSNAAGNATIEKKMDIMMIVMMAILFILWFAVGWGMLAMHYRKQTGARKDELEELEKAGLRLAKLTWWQYILVVIAPVIILAMLGMYKGKVSDGPGLAWNPNKMVDNQEVVVKNAYDFDFGSRDGSFDEAAIVNGMKKPGDPQDIDQGASGEENSSRPSRKNKSPGGSIIKTAPKVVVQKLMESEVTAGYKTGTRNRFNQMESEILRGSNQDVKKGKGNRIEKNIQEEQSEMDDSMLEGLNRSNATASINNSQESPVRPLVQGKKSGKSKERM